MVQLLQQYRNAMAILANTSQSEVTALVDKILVLASITLSEQVADIDLLKAVVAEQAGPEILPMHVKVQTQGAADLRRLAQSQVSAEITVPASTDIVVKAKQIQTRMQDSAALRDTFARRNVTVVVDTTVKVKVSMNASLKTTITLVAGDIDSHISQSLGGFASITSIETDIDGPVTNSSENNITVFIGGSFNAAADGAEQSEIISFAVMCVSFAVSMKL